MERSETSCPDMGIDGVCFQPLKVITTPGGPVMHMLRPDSPLRPHAETADGELHLGEVYFSEVLPGAIKAWKRHRRQTQYYTVPHGLLKLVLYDTRPDSPTRGVLREVYLGRPDHYGLLRIPTGVWYGFTAATDEPALICNCADLPHDPEEGERLPADTKDIPYTWA